MSARLSSLALLLLVSGCDTLQELVGGSDDGGASTAPALVRCAVDDDCAKGREFCHPERKVCVRIECVPDLERSAGGDRECKDRPDGRHCCDPAYYRCVTCLCSAETEADMCAETEYCDVAIGACRRGCRDENVCTASQFCDHRLAERACKERGCSADAACSQEQYCERTPVEPPQYDPPREEGGEPRRVYQGHCQAGCRVSEADACEVDRRCDPARHRCVPFSCTDSEDCEDLSGHAPSGCDPEAGAVCAQPAYCEQTNSQCRLGCLSEPWKADKVQCLDPEQEYCSTEQPPRICKRRECTRDVDCTRPDFYCRREVGEVVGRCQGGCRSGGCPDPTRERCDLHTRRCVVYGCDADEDCDECLAKGECEGSPPHYCYRPTRDCLSGCRDDFDCQEGRSCDLATRECVGDPCPGGDGECLPGEYCAVTSGATRVCKPGCRVAAPETCPPLQPCRPADRLCGCRMGAFDCDPGEDCVEGRCVVTCVDEEPCRALGLVCDLEDGHCTDGCADDVLEPNDSAERATDVATLADPERTEAVMCRTDADWFAVPLEVGQSLEATVRFDVPAGNLDLALFAPEDDAGVGWALHCVPRADGLRRCSRGRASTEALVFPSAPAAGIWHVVVRRFNAREALDASPRVPYTLTLAQGGLPPPCIEDALGGGRPGSNDTRDEARPISPGRFDVLTLCEAPADWYRLDLVPGDEIEVTMRFDHVAADLDLAVYPEARLDPQGQYQPMAGSACDALTCVDPGVERLAAGPVPEGLGGTYYLEVRARRGRATTAYALEIVVERAAP